MGRLQRLEGRFGGVILGVSLLIALGWIGREVVGLLGGATANRVVEVAGPAEDRDGREGGPGEAPWGPGAESMATPDSGEGTPIEREAADAPPGGVRVDAPGAPTEDSGEAETAATGPGLVDPGAPVQDKSLGSDSEIVFTLPEWVGQVSAQVSLVMGDADAFAQWCFDPEGELVRSHAYRLGKETSRGEGEVRLRMSGQRPKGTAALVLTGDDIATYIQRVPSLEASMRLDLGELLVSRPAELQVRFLEGGRPRRVYGGLIVREIGGRGDRLPTVGVLELRRDDEAELLSLQPGSNRLLLVGDRGEVLAHQLIHLDPRDLGSNELELEVLPKGDRSALWVEGLSSLGVPVRIHSEHLLLLGNELPSGGRAPDEFAHRTMHNFSGLESGSYRLIVDDPAFEPDEFTSLRTGMHLHFLSLVGSSALKLQIHDLDTGEAIPRFRARLHSLDPELAFECELPRSEDFEETGLVPELVEGNWAVEVEAPGYVASYARVEMLLPREVRSLRVGMGRGGRIEGRVLDGAGALGVPGIWVECIGVNGELSKMRSEDDGGYRFELLEAGPWQLRAGLEGGEAVVEKAEVRGHETLGDFDLTLPKKPMLRGALGVPVGGRVDGLRLVAIFEDMDYPGRLRSAEGATAQRREAHRMEGAIDAHGRFEIGPLHPGPHGLLLHVPSPLADTDVDPRGGGPGIDWPLATPKAVEVHGKNGASTKLRLGPEAPGHLRVLLPGAPGDTGAVEDTWVLEVVDAIGAPLVATEVREGAAELALPPGTWDLALRSRTDAWRIEGEEAVEVLPGKELEIPWPLALVSMRVRAVDAAEGRPLGESTVRWWDDGGAGGTVTSDGLGWVELQLPPGVYGFGRGDAMEGADPMGVEFEVTESGLAQQDLPLP